MTVRRDVVALQEAHSEATILFRCHATVKTDGGGRHLPRRQEHHQVNQSNVTSKFKQDLRILKP